MAKKDTNNIEMAVFQMFEELKGAIDKLQNASGENQAVELDFSSIEERLDDLKTDLKNIEGKDNSSLVVELQDIKKKINSIPESTRGITTGETERLLVNLQKTLLQAIDSSIKKTTIVKYKLSTWRFYSISTVFLILVCTAGYYANKYYGMKKKKERYEHYYVRYKYLQARKKTTTKADLEWLNKAPTDSIYNLTLVLEENRANKKEQNK